MTRELPGADTHRIGSWAWNRLEAESEGRGWRDVHASLATVNSWAGRVGPSRHHCLAYCVSRPAFLRRRLDGDPAEQMTLRPRQFFVIPAGRGSEWDRRGQTEMLMIYIRQEMLDALVTELGSASRNGRPVEIDLPLGTADPFLEQFALQVLTLLRSPEDGSSGLYIDALARAAALHLLRRHSVALGVRAAIASTVVGVDHRLRTIPDYIDATLAGDLSLAKLADLADLPVNVFGRSFRHVYGTSPHQFVLARRLERAKALLISTDLPISAIALDTGFSSQSHLTTAFRQHAGVTPAIFRQRA